MKLEMKNLRILQSFYSLLRPNRSKPSISHAIGALEDMAFMGNQDLRKTHSQGKLHLK